MVADTTSYQKTIRTLWSLHDSSQVQHALEQINNDIRDLEHLAAQTQGDLRYHIDELLFSYHLLAAHVVRDQRKFSLSHHHANEAVRVARAMQDSDLIATALYTRGCTYLEWGMFGTFAKSMFQMQPEKIEAAIRDLKTAKKAHRDGDKSLHPQLLGRIDLHLSRASVVLTLSKGGQVPGSALATLDEAKELIGAQGIDDPYTRVLVTGHRASFTRGGYHSARAAGFNAAKMPGAALKELNILNALQQGAIGQDLTRHHAWVDIVSANAFMELGEFQEATRYARKALAASQDIHSITHLANIVDIHGRLLSSPYKVDAEVQELGDMLRDALAARIDRNN